jgi:nitric oxide reductase subunit C
MPVYPLSDAQLDDLMAYLRHIDGTGKADPRTFKIHPDGTIAQP